MSTNLSRRRFLKGTVAISVAAVLPPVAAVLPPVAAKEGLELLEGKTVRTGLPPTTCSFLNKWMYRGWEVKYKHSNTTCDNYYATKGEQYIYVKVDRDIQNALLTLRGDVNERSYVNSELDAYIEYANMTLIKGKK